MSTHIDAEVLSICFLIVLFSMIWNEFRRGDAGERHFLLFVFSGILASIFDITARLLVDYRSSYATTIVSMTLYYAVVMIPVLSWLLYTASFVYTDKTAKKRVHIIVTSTYAIFLLTLILNLFKGFYFTANPSGNFIAGPLRLVLTLYFLFCGVAAILFVIVKWQSITQYSLRWLLLLLPTIVAIGVAVQLGNSSWLTIMPSHAVMTFATYMLIQNDHTKKVQAENQETVKSLVSQAQTDGMTGVLNRATTEQLICNALSSSDNKNCLLLIVDMDDLKSTNDRYGHAYGDLAIKSTASVLKSHFRKDDIVGRIGGDEFCAFIYDIPNEHTMKQSIESLSKKLRIKLDENDEKIDLHCSIGGAYGKSGEISFAELYRHADAALYEVKGSGKNGYKLVL